MGKTNLADVARRFDLLARGEADLYGVASQTGLKGEESKKEIRNKDVAVV